ncbi:MAG: hypothetical protein EP332_03970 [Bacteroidetes bacterium]|nr:MAG: hypothetical protein EP332_03970 [Bacteroidota bacterium]
MGTSNYTAVHMLKLVFLLFLLTSQFWLGLIVLMLGLFFVGRKREWVGTWQMSGLFVLAIASVFIALGNQS